MNNLNNASVEARIVEGIKEITNKLMKNTAAVDLQFCPGNDISSQILVTLIGRLATELQVEIPLNCYLFHDKKTLKQLTIKEAAAKLISEAKIIKATKK